MGCPYCTTPIKAQEFVRKSRKKDFKSQKCLIARRGCSIYNGIYNLTHGDCENSHKTCTSPSQTKSYHGGQKVGTKFPILTFYNDHIFFNLMFYIFLSNILRFISQFWKWLWTLLTLYFLFKMFNYGYFYLIINVFYF